MGLIAQDAPQLASRFKAFVSYSHADKAEAQKLHRKLESYRLPKHLRNSTDDIEAADGRIGPIFRDREDLPAAEDLSASVKAALSASEALVVLCSPDAQKSPWVAREIELFRELHPGKPVLAAILRGEPEDAFPEPLKQGREPLAADLRKEGDGPRLGFLKIVAGIAGVPLDTLVNRDAQRNLRRVTAITVASVAAMIVMALMTTFALQARDEAQAQRAEAESLVNYLLTDLRDDLEGVGRLDVMVGVNERALRYFEGLGDLSDLSADSLELNARVLHRIGQDELSLKDGDRDRAKRIFNEAYRTTHSLLQRDPNSGERVFSHAQSAYWIGDIRYKQEHWLEAEAAWKEYLQLALRLEKLPGQQASWALERGYALGNLCTLALHRTDQATQAVEVCQNAHDEVDAYLRLSPEDPKRLSAFANRLGWLGEAQSKSGDLAKGLASYRRQHAILAELAQDDPKNVAKQDQLMRAKMTLAEALANVGDIQGANFVRSNATKMAVNMVDLDPDNLWWREWLARLEKHQMEEIE